MQTCSLGTTAFSSISNESRSSSTISQFAAFPSTNLFISIVVVLLYCTSNKYKANASKNCYSEFAGSTLNIVFVVAVSWGFSSKSPIYFCFSKFAVSTNRKNKISVCGDFTARAILDLGLRRCHHPHISIRAQKTPIHFLGMSTTPSSFNERVLSANLLSP